MNKVQLIDSNFNIDSLSNITKSNYLAIDTEFMREKTFSRNYVCSKLVTQNQ